MLYSFILTTIAGLSTMLGIIPIFFNFKNKNKIISISCLFAACVMIYISIMDLIPESIKYLKFNFLLSFISIISGFIIAIIIDRTVDKVNNNNLYKIGLLSMIAIILHNIPEGIISFIISNNNIKLGITLCLAISLHNIPEGISIAIPIYYSTNNKLLTILYVFISAISELFGAIISYIFLSKIINNTIIGLILSITSGIMISISINNLIPTGYKYFYSSTK